MQEGDAKKMTRYFAEGVQARIWCYKDNGNWAIAIRREAHLEFRHLDELLRSVWWLKRNIVSGSDDLRLWTYDDYDTEITFASDDAALACIISIGQALAFVQSQTTDDTWHQVPSDLFDMAPDPRTVGARDSRVEVD